MISTQRVEQFIEEFGKCSTDKERFKCADSHLALSYDDGLEDCAERVEEKQYRNGGCEAGMTYGAILIDPAWPNDNFVDKGVVPTRASQPYPTMPLNEIAGLPLQDLMAKDCAVFAWAWGRPGKPLRLIRHNQFVWVKTCKGDPGKPRIGMGRWSRGAAESVCVLAKGRPRLGKVPEQVVIDGPRREHSRKPDEIYGRIEALVSGPYLEMFARQKWPGWDQWGNETGKFEVAVA